MNIEAWENWPASIHQEPDQIKRQESAKKAETTPKEINDDYAVFKGSEKDYKTTLVSCTCVDFGRRKKPCKHMYRLAFELGAFPMDYVDVDLSIGIELRIGEAMKIINGLPDDLQKKYMDIIYDVYYGKGYSLAACDDVPLLLQAKLIKDYPDRATILSKLKKDELFKLAPDADKKLKKPELIDYIIQNVDIDYTTVLGDKRMVALDDSVNKIALAMYRKLYDKFRPEEPEIETEVDDDTGGTRVTFFANLFDRFKK